jgi:hypothetical protein
MVWFAVLLFGGLILPIVGGAFADGIFELANARLSAHWPVAEGRVIDSLVKEEHSREGKETSYRYLPSVTYEYEATGRQHKNNVGAFGLRSFDARKKAEAFLRRLPKGALVWVHYDPEDPRSSVLHTTQVWAFRAIVGMLLAVLLGLASVISILIFS